MKLIAFRIENFKSIVDTKWVNLSRDGISCLIGQNESGKSSILEALALFDKQAIEHDYIRDYNTAPRISCKFESSRDEVDKMLGSYSDCNGYMELMNVIEKLEWKFVKTVYSDDEIVSDFGYTDFDEKIENIILENKVDKKSSEWLAMSDEEKSAYERKKALNWANFVAEWKKFQPLFLLFNDEYNLLPNEINVSDLSKDSTAEGKQAVLNLLSIADADLSKLNSNNARSSKQYIASINRKLTINLRGFWTQKVGKGKKLSIELELNHRNKDKAEIAGEPYLQFWIKDDEYALHPRQRSKGVRWFLSFYIALKADSLRKSDSNTIFLIDEPGANLHPRAQEDVLKVLDDVRKTNQILYTTHSQYLIEFENVHRLLAVQRKDELDEESDTIVIPGYHLGSASTNTLAPILEHMGINFSNQDVIARNNNIILEEISAFYYLQAFSIINNSAKYNYLPATGVSNVEHIALLFLGWGLGFSIVFDDDSAGRTAYQNILKNIYNGDENEAKKHVYKIKKCAGIEDIFSREDFAKFLLKKEIQAEFMDKVNSDIAKSMRISKPVMALEFFTAVKAGDITAKDLSAFTKDCISDLYSNIERIVSNQMVRE